MAQAHSTVKPNSLPLAELLRRTPLFAALTEAQLQSIAQGAIKHRYRRDELILQRGAPNRNLYVMLSGKVMETTSACGDRAALLRYLQPGDYFGECSLIDGLPCSVSFQCATATDVIVIDGAGFAAALVQNKTFAMDVIKGLASRLRRATRHIGSLALGNVVDRTATALEEVSSEVDGQHLILGNVSQSDIARMVGASRESVSRAIKDLKQRGRLVPCGAGLRLVPQETAHA